MLSKKLKYLEYLNKYPDCPPQNFKEVSRVSFRWIIAADHPNNFTPLNLGQEPPARMLDETDKMCKGYGLSFFDSLDNAFERYKSLYQKKRQHQREQFKEDKGTLIGEIKIDKADGIANEPDVYNYGHFTFHEYNDTNLNSKPANITNIFEQDGESFNRTFAGC
jgi:hypothetical protein